MSKISLYQYHEQIEEMIEESRLTEAAAHCRHILEQQPRHIATYRLLGKSLLEQQKYEDAIDIFQRVLSADPEDFISHVGLAIAYKAEQLVSLATWHMERAYEIEPYNVGVQDEMRALYGSMDAESAPARLVLTRGALARLHCRSEMYGMANAGIRQILAEDDTRVDLQVLLAESLWRDDQRIDAVKVCLDILDKLPNCINANAILAEVWLLTGRENEATPYVDLLYQLTLVDGETLDLESPTGRALSTAVNLSIPDQVFIDELDEVPFAYATGNEETGLSWIGELDDIDESVDDMALDWFGSGTDLSPDDKLVGKMPANNTQIEDVPEWLREISDEVDVAPTDLADEISEKAVAEITEIEPEDDTPDWLNNIDDTPALPESSALDWFSDLNTNSLPPQATGRKAENSGFTDWLAQQDSAEEPDLTLPDEADLALDKILQEVEEPEAGELPSWLQEALADEPTILPDIEPDEKMVVEEVLVPESDMLPDWLEQLDNGVSPKSANKKKVESPHSDSPDWLDELGIDDSFVNSTSAEGDIEELGEIFDDALVQTGDISGLLNEAVTVAASPTEKSNLKMGSVPNDELDDELASWLEEVQDDLEENDF
jgi:tetratricopeptide (TPR) repeat protein